MKCYFALSDDVSNKDNYYWMFVAAINSAKKNTSLELHCLYDFRKTFVENIEDDRIYKLLKEKKVIIHITKIDFENELLNVYTDEYLKKINITKNSLYSRFLRFQIADIENTDKYVFYVDTDVLFLHDITEKDLKMPKTVSVCPEFDKTYKFDYFNAGIMLLNMDSYRQAKLKLINMLRDGKHPKIECCDQGYLNDIYHNNFEKLSLNYNWKPYWGENHEAVIIHLHGFKPEIHYPSSNICYIEWISHILSKEKDSKSGCIHYFSEFVKYADNKDLYYPVMTNILCMLACQKYDMLTFKNRVIRKLKKIFRK